MIDPANRTQPAGDAPAPRTVDELIQARIQGRLTRRQLIARAAALGIAAPVVGVMLHATSDRVVAAPVARLQGGQPIKADKPTAPAGSPAQGGTVVAGGTDKLDTLNAYVTALVVGSDVNSGVMDALLTYDSTQQLVPALATENSISEDGLTYTFKLRPNVTFHNGDPFTAQDVIETWKMIVNPEAGAVSQLGWDKITDITAPDPLTAVMVTKEVYAPFLAYVAGGLGTGTPIAPAKALTAGPQAFKEAFTLAPIGTGPFKVTEARLNEQVTLERYDGYWGTKPKLDKIIYRIVPDTNTQLVQLRTGELQVAASGGALGSTEVDQALGFDTITVLEHDTMAWSHLDLKNIGFLTDTLVRQALDFATPKQQIVEQLYKGRSTVAYADQAPISWVFNPNIQPRPYDLEQAKKLLDEAGLVPGSDGVREKDGVRFELELWGVAGDTSSQQVIQIVANSWTQIGVKATTNFQDTSTLWGPEGYQWNEKMTACLYSWFNGNDPDDMYYWHSSQIPKDPEGAGGNGIAYFNKFSFQAEIDALTQQAAQTVDQEQRKQLYWQIQELLFREVPVIFISWGKAFPAVAKNIGGVWPSAYNRVFWNAAEWYIAE